MKYVDYAVVFAEVPDEISLAVNISNCPCGCEGCHSSYLSKDIGEELDIKSLTRLLSRNQGVTCVCLMGGDASPKSINDLAEEIRRDLPGLKIAWYSGRAALSGVIQLKNFDYIKLGPYISSCGPLTSRSTNQKFYRIKSETMYDETFRFFKN